MGIQNREYMRDDGPGWRIGGRRADQPSAVTLLIIANVVVFVAQLMTDRSGFLERWLALDPQLVMSGQIWRLTTYDFLHDTRDILHLVFNMWLLYLAGRRVEANYGRNEFLAFYLTAGIVSGILFMIWGAFTGTPGVAVGASGAAVAVMIVYAMNWPHDRWLLWGILPMPVIVLALIAAAWDILPMLGQLQGRGPGDGIAHSAHIGGMLFGFLYVHFRWRLTGWFQGTGERRWQNPFRRRPKLRVHNPPEPEDSSISSGPLPVDVESRVDELLEKIASHGEASLTNEERKFLTDASRRYRHRH